MKTRVNDQPDRVLGGGEVPPAAVPPTGARSILPEQVVVAPKHLGLDSQQQFRDAASALIERTTTHTGRLVINCSRLESIDSAGLNTLILVQRKAAKRHVRVILWGMSDELLRLLVLTKLKDLFEFQDREVRGTTADAGT